MAIQVCELQTAWQEGLRTLEERRHWLLSLSGCCDPDDARRRLSPTRQEEVDRLDQQIKTYQGDQIYQALWHQLLPQAANVTELFPSQRSKQPDPELSPAELEVAVVWYRLRREGVTEVTSSSYQHELECEKAWFTAQEMQYLEVAATLVRVAAQPCLELDVLDSAVSLIVAQPTLQSVDAVAEAVERLHASQPRHWLSGQGIVDIGDVKLDGETIRACGVLAMYQRFTDAGLFDAVDRVTADAISGTIDLECATVEELKAYALQLERRWPSLDQVNALQSRLFDDAFYTQWISLIRAGHDFIFNLTYDEIQYVGLSRIHAESVRAPALEVASMLTDRASSTVELIARPLAWQIEQARAILVRPDVRTAYGARDWRGVVVATTSGVTQEDVQQRVELAENTGILLSWLGERAKHIGHRRKQFIHVEAIIDGKTSKDPLSDPTDADAAEAWDALYAALDLAVTEQPAAPVLPPVTDSEPPDGAPPLLPPPMPTMPAKVKLQASMFPAGVGG